MRLSARTDLGGFAAGLDVMSEVAKVEIDRPFTLLCGANGSGKTGLLRMMRAATGVEGDRGGRMASDFDRAATPEACAGDLGKLATFKDAYRTGAEPPREFAGVLDVEAMGWRGQRTWLFNARAETALVEKGSFDDDFMHHVSMLVGSKRRSHGQLLGGSWMQALNFGLGTRDLKDGYDTPERIPAARRELFGRACPDGVRSEERWLFLDEPETALDAESLSAGLCALLHEAEIGKLRVFCASHSPIFAAGIGTHPKVQVVDLGRPNPWLDVQRRMLELARDPDRVSAMGKRVADGIKLASAKEREAARKAAESELRATVKALGKRARELVLAAHDASPEALRAGRGDGQGAFSRSTIEGLRDRKLIKASMGMRPEITLTPEGRKVASVLVKARDKAREAEAPGAPAP